MYKLTFFKSKFVEFTNLNTAYRQKILEKKFNQNEQFIVKLSKTH